jgi:hypothetical protein
MTETDSGFCFTLTLVPELCTLAESIDLTPELDSNINAAQFESYLKQAFSKWRTCPRNRWLWNTPLGKLPERDQESIKIAAYILMNTGE